MSKWAPAGLPEPLQSLIRAIDRQFAPKIPDAPPRLPGVAQADLTDALAERHPYGVAINKDTGKLVRSALSAGVWKWKNADGSAL